jgi:probable rRNA maturation factor
MNTIAVSYESEDMAALAPETKVVETLHRVLKELGVAEVEISCAFVSDDSIRALNRTYREKDESTDILSFPQIDEDDEGFIFNADNSDDEDAYPGPELLGDMIISLESMQRNCESYNVTTEEELIRLLIHGTLHLLGEDHDSNDSQEPMLQQQEQLLNTLLKESGN